MPGTAGRVENAQVAVFLTYATERGHAFIDRRLYLPESWASDPDRRTEAGVPDEARFATKPHLAAAMITDALAAGAPARWAPVTRSPALTRTYVPPAAGWDCPTCWRSAAPRRGDRRRTAPRRQGHQPAPGRCVGAVKAAQALDGVNGKHIDAARLVARRSAASSRAQNLRDRHEKDGNTFPKDNPSSDVDRFPAAVEGVSGEATP
ncbi:transposase [Myceligenerans pegani]|uniref:Transposase n=1 Tax=Myceligenerans pegani TaxID=2776917 RepID=A0ABR9N2G6_9MICO|nr:transposase [Myceligenerans sp. TRM 65318]MBE3019752.1 transposase [Myceligenerans sp. TRM 65318]